MYSVRFQPLRLQCRVCLASAPSERRLYSVTQGQYKWRERRALTSGRRKVSTAHIVSKSHRVVACRTLLYCHFLTEIFLLGTMPFKKTNTYYLFYRESLAILLAAAKTICDSLRKHFKYSQPRLNLMFRLELYLNVMFTES